MTQLITIIVKRLTSFGFQIGFNYQWIEKDKKERETKPTRGKRCICDFVTTDRRDRSDRKVSASSRGGKEVVHNGRIELDSHADTIVFGKNCVVLNYTGRECDVLPYTDTYESINSVPIAKSGTAWTSPETGATYILVFNEGLWMGDKMNHSLINPNQLRLYGATVQDNPVCDYPLYIMTEDGEFVLTLGMKGTNVMANTHRPTMEELHDCMHITLSSHHLWDPHRVRFPESSRTVQEEIDEVQISISGVGVSYES